MRSLRAFFTLTAREVESYFFAPLMYLVLAVFLLLNGFAFYVSLVDLQGNVDLAVRNFLGESWLFWITNLLIPPLLTMRLIAEERRSGTIEGLMTAPVTDTAVVVAKYVGALSFYVALWVPSIVYLLVLKSYGTLPDAGVLATSYLGIFLLGAMLIAFGLLASAVSPSQIVAAIIGVVFNVMLFIGPMLHLIMPRGALRSTLGHVWILFHFQNSFSKGILDTGIVSFYVVVIAMCLFLAVRAVEFRRWS